MTSYRSDRLLRPYLRPTGAALFIFALNTGTMWRPALTVEDSKQYLDC